MTTGTPMTTETGSWRGWSLALVVIDAVLAGLGLLVVLGGIALVISDESSETDEFDGLVTGIGILFGGAGLLLALAFVGLLLWTVSGRRQARGGEPTRLRMAATANLLVGFFPAVLPLLLRPWFGGTWGRWLLVDLVGLALMAAGALVLRSLRHTPRT